MYENGRFVDALYLAGVAVECLLRAYGTDAGSEFDGRHDLLQLMKGGAERLAGEGEEAAILAAIGHVWVRWKNNYRYTHDPRLRAEFKRLRLDRGLKGDALKENARIALASALIVVYKGTSQWKK